MKIFLGNPSTMRSMHYIYILLKGSSTFELFLEKSLEAYKFILMMLVGTVSAKKIRLPGSLLFQRGNDPFAW